MRKLPDRRQKRSLRAWRRRLLLILFGVIFGLGLVEIGLRLIGYSYPEFYVSDVARGYSLRPNMQGWYRKEGEAYVRINSDGLRDREHSKIKPPHTFRIAVLGDSFVEALQVPFEQSFCHIVEQQLRSCPAMAGRDVEVINFGVSGYGTAQELITLRNQVWPYSPDLVLLTVTTNNDISDNSPALKKTNQIPYFVWRDESLVEDDTFQQTRSFQSRNNFLGRAGRWLRDHLRLVQAVQQAAFAARVMREQSAAKSSQPARPVNGPPNSVTPTDELGVDNLVYREPSDPAWINAWAVTEQLIKTMRSEVESKGLAFAVMTLSNPPQVLPTPASREAFLQRVGAKDIFYPDHRIAQFCGHAGISVATLAPAMQQYAQQNNVMLHGFGRDVGNGHWNVAGHHLAGQLAAEEICKLLANRKSE